MKDDQRPKKAKNLLFQGRLVAVLSSVFLGAMLIALVVVVWQRATTPLPTGDYEGTIVDRWADYYETEEGSRPRLALVVETSDRKRFTVRVDPNVYESARVGMRIKSRSGQIVLIESEKGTTVGKY